MEVIRSLPDETRKEIGETLKSLLELVLDDPELNNRELLLERICSHE